MIGRPMCCPTMLLTPSLPKAHGYCYQPPLLDCWSHPNQYSYPTVGYNLVMELLDYSLLGIPLPPQGVA